MTDYLKFLRQKIVQAPTAGFRIYLSAVVRLAFINALYMVIIRLASISAQTESAKEVTSDGENNTCSVLYGAAWRAAKALGYKRIVTYTRQSENGASLRAAGWQYDGPAGGTHWTGQRYEQVELVLDEPKVRWRKDAT